jgi:drug/metabolite transporter (DMT)-like permease
MNAAKVKHWPYFCPMTDKLRAYLYLHICVFIWGFTAILGKLISLKAVPLVWWRVILACATLVFLIPKQQWRDLSKATVPRLFGIGILVGLHWLCFYGAIKLSNASIAVATMATTAFFSSMIEPLLRRQPIKWYELGLGLLILPGMALVAGNINWQMQVGFGVGVLGALLAAIFSSLNKQVLEKSPPPPLVMTFVELFAAACICSLFMPVLWWQSPETSFIPVGQDWIWLLVLVWVCTLLPYYLTLLAMRHISAFTANLAINLEPIYGIFLAALLFREDKDLSPHFYLGMTVVLLAVFSHPFLKHTFEK